VVFIAFSALYFWKKVVVTFDHPKLYIIDSLSSTINNQHRRHHWNPLT
jgi:hypothetical protein